MPVLHLVLFKFIPTITEAQISEWKEKSAALVSTGVVRDMKIGDKIPNGFDKGWDNGFLMTFDTPEDLAIYQPHPDHVAYKEFLKPLTTDKMILDLQV